jgi:hypothetical protein
VPVVEGGMDRGRPARRIADCSAAVDEALLGLD